MLLNKLLPITIAAGHVGNAGATGCGYREETLTKELVELIYNKLRSAGYDIRNVSPKGSYGATAQLVAEYNNANTVTNAQLHLCIHFNASNGKGNGTETWIYAFGNEANKYATPLTNSISNAIGITNRGVKASGTTLCIPMRVKAPVCLIEVCFIDNADDIKKYINNKDKVADAIVKALIGEYSVNTPIQSNQQTSDDWVKRLQAECNIQGFSNQKVDNIPGPNTLKGCPVLRKGAAGAITKLLQEKLGISADGVFGNETYNAVINYQKSKGLDADGVVGQNTWRKLLEL